MRYFAGLAGTVQDVPILPSSCPHNVVGKRSFFGYYLSIRSIEKYFLLVAMRREVKSSEIKGRIKQRYPPIIGLIDMLHFTVYTYGHYCVYLINYQIEIKT